MLPDLSRINLGGDRELNDMGVYLNKHTFKNALYNLKAQWRMIDNFNMDF